MNFGSRKKTATMARKCVSVSLLTDIKNNAHPASLHSYCEDTKRQHTTSFTANMLRNLDLLLLFKLKRIVWLLKFRACFIGFNFFIPNLQQCCEAFTKQTYIFL